MSGEEAPERPSIATVSVTKESRLCFRPGLEVNRGSAALKTNPAPNRVNMEARHFAAVISSLLPSLKIAAGHPGMH